MIGGTVVVVGFLTHGQRGEEEPGVVPAGLDRRGDPVVERAQTIRGEGQLLAGQEGTERQLVGLELGARRVVPPRVGDGRAVPVVGEEDAALLEGLAGRGADQPPCARFVAAEALGPPRGGGAGPGEVRVVVGGVDATPGEHGHPAGEGHALDAARDEHLRAGIGVADHHHGGGVLDGAGGGLVNLGHEVSLARRIVTRATGVRSRRRQTVEPTPSPGSDVVPPSGRSVSTP